ncbi:cell division cycle 14 [Cryptococcus deuterogattii CBS 10090]|nr:cell division cycle 14 [Cryptococcus deuterogattii CBS 10090]
MPSTSTRAFPNEVAIFSNYLLFTTLTLKEVQAHAKIPYGHPGNKRPCSLFTLDDDMRYTSFAMDHGPLNLAFTFHACIRIHEKLEKARERGKPVCLYTTTEPKMKSNMILIVALYSLIVDKQPPWSAFRPIAQFEVMPFRDAGSGPMDYGLTVQDILYGVEKAIGNGLLDLASFDADEYQYYEMVQEDADKSRNGDLNILGPFIPFASPTESSWIEGALQSASSEHIVHTPAKSKAISHQLHCVLDVFQREDVGLVARLNDELYDRRHFLDVGIEHIEMFFDDGTNPPDDIVREFIRLAEHTIENKRQKVAVHCKAGLGRTGVLIGAYLVYKYQFTAQEAIGFMRIVRPGMVVGPQQQYMVLNQLKWAGWAARDQALKEIAQTSCTESNPPIAPPVEVVIKGIETETHIRPVTPSSKLRPRRSHSSSSLATISPRRGGDAIGQPRKTRQVVESTTETEQERLMGGQSHLLSCSPPVICEVASDVSIDQKENEFYPSTVSSLGSIRGTKRSASRPSSGHGHSNPLPRVSLNIPPSSLSRSDSNVSIGSEGSVDERPTKRRTESSPEAEESGATVSPVSEPMAAEQVETPVRLTVTKKLRRRISSSSPAPAPTFRPSASRTTPLSMDNAASTETPSTPTRAPRALHNDMSVTASVQRTMPTKKSFLPVRKNLESKSSPVRNATISTTFQSPSLSTRTSVRVANTLNKHQGIAVNSNSNAKNVKTTTSASRKLERRVTKRGMLTPPRITEMWGQLSRIGSSPPGDKEKP